VQQLQGPEQAQHAGIGRLVGVGRHGAPAPVGECRSEPLAAAQHELFERGRQAAVVGADVCGVAATLAEILPQLVGDGAGQLNG
jgi:hypothetical protein